jgi:hypothetical protein
LDELVERYAIRPFVEHQAVPHAVSNFGTDDNTGGGRSRRLGVCPSRNNSTAWRNDTPSARITQSTTLPPHPDEHRQEFDFADTTNPDGSASPA